MYKYDIILYKSTFICLLVIVGLSCREIRMNKKEFNQLIRRAAIDESAVEKLYIFYYKRIVYHLLSRHYSLELSKDVAQEFFVEIVAKSDIPKEIVSPSTWIYECCERIAERKTTGESYYAALQENSNPLSFEDFIPKEKYEALYAEMKKLDWKSRQIVQMIYWEGYTQKEIADILSMKASAVRQRHFCALRELRGTLGSITKFDCD